LASRSKQSGIQCLAIEGVSALHESIKEDALRLIERLPADATWEDLQYEIYVRQVIDAGLKDSRDGRTVSSQDVRRQFGLKGQ
jgi:hypothetical protein